MKTTVWTISVAAVVFLITALYLAPVKADAGVRQVASAQTPNANCTYTPDGNGQYIAACDPIPNSITVTFSPTLAGSQLVFTEHWIASCGSPNNCSQMVITGCTDSSGQIYTASGNDIVPPAGGNFVGLTSLTCQFSFPNPPDASSVTAGQWGAMDMVFYEVTGIPAGASVTVSSACSVVPAPNAVTVMIDYTSPADGYTPAPVFGDFGLPGTSNSSLLTLTYSGQNTPFYSLPFYFTSIYTTVGNSGTTATFGFAGATQCRTITYPEMLPETGVNLGDCEGHCDEVGGSPINLTNGNVFIKQQDYTLPGLGGGLTLERTWNSLWPLSTHANTAVARMFGDSWTSNLEERLVVVDNETVDYWRADGSKYRFNPVILDCCGIRLYGLAAPLDVHVGLSFNYSTNQYSVCYGNHSCRFFDTAGFPLSIVDPHGNTTTFTYDGMRRLAQVTDAASRSITFTYGDPVNTGQVTSAQDATGTIATYAYDSSQRLTRVTYSDGSFNSFTYDSNSRILSVTDTDGKILESHTYDVEGRGLTSARAGGVEQISVTYNSGISILTDSLGRPTQYPATTINQRNVLTGISGSGCATCGGRGDQTFMYDNSGHRTSSTDVMGNTTQYTYDSGGNVASRSVAVNGAQVTWNFTYDSFDQLTTATDPLGNKTTNNYANSQGQETTTLLSTTTPSPGGSTPGSKTSFTYDTKGQLLTVTDPLNHVTTLTYTPAGLVQTVTDAQHKVTSFQYDARGNRTAIIDALNQQTTFAYDSRNRLTSITYPNLAGNINVVHLRQPRPPHLRDRS